MKQDLMNCRTIEIIMKSEGAAEMVLTVIVTRSKDLWHYEM